MGCRRRLRVDHVAHELLEDANLDFVVVDVMAMALLVGHHALEHV